MAAALFTSVTARAAMEPHVDIAVSSSRSLTVSSYDIKPQLPPEKQFIITLERLPVLWEKTHLNYTNKFKRNEALRKLLLILKRVNPNATIEHVRMKINSIRSNYRRELRKVLASQRSGVGPDEVYTPKSWSYEYLGFLYNSERPVNQELDYGNADEEKTEYETETQYDLNAASQNSENSFEFATPSSSKKIKRENIAKQNDAQDHFLLKPNTSDNHIQLATNSNNYIAFEWAETLNRLDPTQRLYAKKAINDILFEAELGHLNRITESSALQTSSSGIQIHRCV